MQELKKIGILSTGKIFALFGFLIGIFTVIFSKMIYSLNPEIALASGAAAESLGLGSSLLGIVFSVAIYFVVGIIGAALYNLFSKWVGGIRIELEEPKVKEKKQKKK
tara:strand:- start:17 stop:337 length:321 start_codon:yes stop_codon:yes gene_type:complete